MGVVFGFVDICPSNSNVPKFTKQCASGQYDMLLHKNGVHLSPIVKDLMKNMLFVDEKKRFTMQQVLDHRYFVESLSNYKQGYDSWCQQENERL